MSNGFAALHDAILLTGHVLVAQSNTLCFHDAPATMELDIRVGTNRTFPIAATSPRGH